jgi:hypothetical protein
LKPIAGDIVHYACADPEVAGPDGEPLVCCTAAIVTAVCGPTAPVHVCLCAFRPGAAPEPKDGVPQAEGYRDEASYRREAHTWHWPEREETAPG